MRSPKATWDEHQDRWDERRPSGVDSGGRRRHPDAMRSLRVPRAVLLAVALFWIGSAFADAAARQLDPDAFRSPWGHFVSKRALIAAFWMLTSVLAFVYYRDRPITGANLRRSIPTTTALALAVSGLFFAYLGGVLHLVSGGARTWAQGLAIAGPVEILYGFLTAWQVAIGANAYHYYVRMMDERRAGERLETQLRETKLMLFRAQLEPHFLFNALNSIAALVRLDRKEPAIEALSRLSHLLRGVLEVGSQRVMPWHWENEFSETYIALQKLRFGDDLDVRFAVDGVPPDAPVPILLLQPLIENAIRHGPLEDGERCEVSIHVHARGARIRVEVGNVVGKHPAPRSKGLGLSNLAARLHSMYGDDFELSHAVAGERFVVAAEFPACT